MLSRSYDILCVGELLVDLISEEITDSSYGVDYFKRVPGGSPAHLCSHMARLGGRTRLAACVGRDKLGDFLKDQLAQSGVDVSLIRQVESPTSLALATRSDEAPGFEVYRSADVEIGPDQLPDNVLKHSRLFHTTCFALSKEPARQHILEAAGKAHRYNCQLSLDLNYIEKIWPDREEAKSIVRRYCAMGALVKVGEVDWIRLYENPSATPKEAASFFQKLGAQQVCITLGNEGCYVEGGMTSEHLQGRQIDIKDNTGAGDAFLAGYLSAWLDGYSPRSCARAGMRMAELKIADFGPLPPVLDKKLIYEDNT